MAEGKNPPGVKHLGLPLTHGLEEEDCGADGDVQAVQPPKHRDADMGRCSPAPLVRETGGLSAHHKGGSAAHIYIIVQRGVLKLRRKYLYAAGLKECNCFFRTAGHRGYGKHSAYGSPYEIGVVEVREWVADKNCIGPCCVCAAEHRAKIPGLFNGLQHHYQRILRKIEITERALLVLHFRYDSLSGFTVCNLAVQRLRNFDDLSLCG